MNVKIKILDKRISIPQRATSGSAGFDLQACIDEELILMPGESKLVPTGLIIHIDQTKVVGCIFPRSKIGAKQGIVLGNLTGIIDSDYTGQWFVSVWNRNFNDPVKIKPLESIAQVVFLQLADVNFTPVEEIEATERNDGGISKEEDTILKEETCLCGSNTFTYLYSMRKKKCIDCGASYNLNEHLEIKHQRG